VTKLQLKGTGTLHVDIGHYEVLMLSCLWSVSYNWSWTV